MTHKATNIFTAQNFVTTEQNIKILDAANSTKSNSDQVIPVLFITPVMDYDFTQCK
jgi:hypothetical protein